METQVFTVPAPDSPGSQQMPFPPGTRIYGDFLHMHYLSFDEKVTVTRANGSPDQPKEECLAHTFDEMCVAGLSLVYPMP
ncbi:hypothetical protein WMF37_39970 [Sorangium sp. So ce291]|uniref:hypothetical protein n=1 Tax=Sorangium sp. So ce291 TaxID=3133294 RepID=UPI003F60B86D